MIGLGDIRGCVCGPACCKLPRWMVLRDWVMSAVWWSHRSGAALLSVIHQAGADRTIGPELDGQCVAWYLCFSSWVIKYTGCSRIFWQDVGYEFQGWVILYHYCVPLLCTVSGSMMCLVVVLSLVILLTFWLSFDVVDLFYCVVVYFYKNSNQFSYLFSILLKLSIVFIFLDFFSFKRFYFIFSYSNKLFENSLSFFIIHFFKLISSSLHSFFFSKLNFLISLCSQPIFFLWYTNS